MNRIQLSIIKIFKMIKVYKKRAFMIILCVIPIAILLYLLYKDVTYMKTLNLKPKSNINYDFNEAEEDVRTPHRVIKAAAKIPAKSTSAPGINGTVKYSTLQNSNITNHGNITSIKEILMRDLHKYTINNPGFRHLTEWPPFRWEPPENPSLAEIWGINITKDMPNWEKFLYQMKKYYLYEDTPFIEDLLHDMASKKIIAVDLHPGGTQFKLIVGFEDGGRALFKPMRFPRDVERNKNVLYLSDYERHISEIAAFHLDRILGFRRVPPVVGRKINITGELFPLVTDDEYFVDSFFFSPDGNYCFAGICKMYCSELYGGFCGNPFMLEGSFAYYIPQFPVELLEQREIMNPWRRTYEINEQALWETETAYCQETVNFWPPFNQSRRLYDVIDCAIFDFLIGNEDRFNFDEFTVFGEDDTPTMIHLDNGQGFGFSNHDDVTILEPLTNCCVLRLSTFNKLYDLYTGQIPLSELMRRSLSKDPLSPILTKPHLEAMDRRLEIILRFIRLCINQNSPSIVLKDDVL